MRIVRDIIHKDYLYSLLKIHKVVIYARVSKKEQRSSLTVQLTFLKQLVTDKYCWDFAGAYSDIHSGLNFNRPGFRQMLGDAFQKKFDIILVKSVSRLSRNIVDFIKLIRELREINVKIVSDANCLDTDNTDEEFRLQMTAAFAEEESKDTSDAIKWGLRDKYKKGEVSINCANFLGYDNGPGGGLIINEEQAVIVRRIFQEFLAGRTFYFIAKGLEKDNIKTGSGGFKWYPNKIRQILENEKYIGDAHLNKYITTDIYKRKVEKNDGQVKSYYVENDHPAIISREDFEKAQEKLNN